MQSIQNKLIQLKTCKDRSKYKILGTNDIYVIFQTEYDTALNVKIDDLRQFIDCNKIQDLEIKSDSQYYDLIATTKIEELHIIGVEYGKNVYWDKIINCVKNGNVKRIVFTLLLHDAEFPQFVELLGIKTLIAVEIRTVTLLTCSQIILILPELEKNYHLLGCEFNIDKNIRDRLEKRNMSIRNEIIHFSILDFSIALCSLIDIGFGPYVLLEIFDWINWNYLGDHRLKIRIIENVCRFRRSIKGDEKID